MKRRNQDWTIALVVAGVCALFAVGIAVSLATKHLRQQRPPEKARAAPEAKKRKTATGAELEELRQAVQELGNNGAFTRLESENGIPTMWVTATFLGLDFKQKEGIVQMVSMYTHKVPRGASHDELGLVILKDTSTGRIVGEFGPIFGLQMK